MSLTSPTFVALNDQLIKAHHRIRELEARETELLAQISILCAVNTTLLHDVHARCTVGLASTTVQPSSPDEGSDRRFGIGDHLDTSNTAQSACPRATHSQATATRPAAASTSRLDAKRPKTRQSHVV
jgi:hypothetical protein